MKFYYIPEGAYKVLMKFMHEAPFYMVESITPMLRNSMQELDPDLAAQIMERLAKKAAQGAVEKKDTDKTQ